MKKIATFVYQIDPLFILRSSVYRTHDVYFIVQSNSSMYGWIEHFIPASKIITYDKEDKNYKESYSKELLQVPNLLEKLKNLSIEYIFSTEVLPFKTVSFEKHAFHIISPDNDLQKKFENKLWFDAFLKSHNTPHPNGGSYNFKNNRREIIRTSVIQKAESWGNEGTFTIKSDNDIEKLVHKNIILPTEDVLVRDFIKGTSYGISVFVALDAIYLSPLRKQCFFHNDHRNQDLFAGIQWIRTDMFSKKVVKKIDSIFLQLGELLSVNGLRGFANFDFIIDDCDDVYVIECNPRFSASTTHLLWEPSLLHDADIFQLLFNAYFNPHKGSLNMARCRVPDSRFEGSFINIDIHLDKSSQIFIKHQYKNGLYNQHNSTLQYAGEDLTQSIADAKQCIFFSETEMNDAVMTDATIGYIITNYPLFDSAGLINKSGRDAMENFTLV